MEIRSIRAYQIDKLIADFEAITSATTLADAKTIIMGSLDYQCPQCGGTGTIDTNDDDVKDTECPTCEGNQKTEVQKRLSRAQSNLIYVNAG